MTTQYPIPADHPWKQQWVIVGGGRLGRGFLSLCAQELQYWARIFVAGENTSDSDVLAFRNLANSGTGYDVALLETVRRTSVMNYFFFSIIEMEEFVDAVASPESKVLSTSVGLEHLGEVARLIARGLKARADSGADKILILVCENGMISSPSQAPETASLWFERELQSHYAEALSVAEVAGAVVDARIPMRRPPGESLLISDGHMWVEETPLVKDIMRRSDATELRDERVRILPKEEFKVVHSRKLYGFNTPHCLMSAIGSLVGCETVDQVATNSALRPVLEKLADQLIRAICERHMIEPSKLYDGESTREYVERCFRRLGETWQGGFDPVSRSTERVQQGWYLSDSRLSGPIVDLGLGQRPKEAFELCHAIALCLYYFSENIERIRGSLAWLPPDRRSLNERLAVQSLSDSTFKPLKKATVDPLFQMADGSQFMELVAQDYRILNRAEPSVWSIADVVEYLGRSVEATGKPVAPKKPTTVAGVVFDLDEGLVGTESLLFDVTRNMISKCSSPGAAFTHDEYARYVGVSELSFFEQMIRKCGIRGKTAEQLIGEREASYIEELNLRDADSLVKPGFRSILNYLSERNSSCRLAVSSNASNNRVERTLDHVGLRMYFDPVVTASKDLAPKPEPDLFVSIAEKWGVKPSDILVIESSVFGVEAALAAGCYCILLVNDYTAPERIRRRGVEIMTNAQALRMRIEQWF
jgi:pseudouridine 5'-phosphatase